MNWQKTACFCIKTQYIESVLGELHEKNNYFGDNSCILVSLG